MRTQRSSSGPKNAQASDGVRISVHQNLLSNEKDGHEFSILQKAKKKFLYQTRENEFPGETIH